MNEVRVGINGFGRIGRAVFKILSAREGFRVVAVNDLADPDDLAYLLKYDSVHGVFPRAVSAHEGSLTVDGVATRVLAQKDPAQLPWGDLGADLVIESTGIFKKREKAALHLAAGAKRVIISAPSGDADATLVLGVNEDIYDPARHQVISMASCTTNCLAPVAKVLVRDLGIDSLMFTTVHAYTASQALLDAPIGKRRKGRAAALSIIPSETGASEAVDRVLPEIAGRTHGLSLRVPVPDGSITDLVAYVQRDTTAAEVNDLLRRAAREPRLQGILRVSEDELVSQDIVGDPASSIIDAASTAVLQGRIVKVLAWYDNEWGYSTRLADCVGFLAAKGV